MFNPETNLRRGICKRSDGGAEVYYMGRTSPNHAIVFDMLDIFATVLLRIPPDSLAAIIVILNRLVRYAPPLPRHTAKIGRPEVVDNLESGDSKCHCRDTVHVNGGK